MRARTDVNKVNKIELSHKSLFAKRLITRQIKNKDAIYATYVPRKEKATTMDKWKKYDKLYSKPTPTPNKISCQHYRCHVQRLAF